MTNGPDFSPDPDVERAYQWLLTFLPDGEWDRRKSAIEAHLESMFQPKPSPVEADHLYRLVGGQDRLAWYLYLAESSLYEPHRTEIHQASRVLPVLRRLGEDLDRLLRIGGIEAQAAKLVGSSRDQPDAVLFEMLVALLWAKNGWNDVSFVPASPSEKRPDIRATNAADEWFIETKRMAAHSEYARRERDKWLRMWLVLKDCLINNRYPFILDITIHVELESLADDFLLEQLEQKLKLVSVPCHLISNEVWDVAVRFVDFNRVNRHMYNNYVKEHSRQLQELIGGAWERSKGFTLVMSATRIRVGGNRGINQYIDDISWAAAAYWNCDAERSIEAKARDIRRHLSDALEQLPASGKGAVHVGLETHGGSEVEAERLNRIVNTVTSFDAKGKDLRWVYVHLYESYSPPETSWLFDETIYKFSIGDVEFVEPIAMHYTVVSSEAGGTPGTHWQRPAP